MPDKIMAARSILEGTRGILEAKVTIYIFDKIDLGAIIILWDFIH